MKFNGRRLLKSSIPLGTFAFFILLLTFHLYHRPIRLGNLQHIGWQAYDIVSYSNATVSSPVKSPPSSPPASNGTTDWWEVENEQEDQGVPTSFRLDVWNPLTPHHTGLTEIAIRPCLFLPQLVKYCDPRTTEEEDALKGPWVRVDRDLNVRTGRWWLSVWYRRSRRLDVPLITSVLILSDDEIDLLPEPKSMWHKAPGSLVDGQRSNPSREVFLWYRLRPPLTDATDDEEVQDVITELDVLYGEDRPFFGFEKVKPELFLTDGKTESVSLVYRRGLKKAPQAKPPHFNHDGTYKIMQIADLHYSVSQGKCLQTNHKPCDQGDVETDRSLLSVALDAEKPDLVVFTGDQLNGQGTSWDSKSVLAKFSRTVEERNISWAAVFGNHDSEQDLTRLEEMKLLEALPYSLAKAGPSEIHGVGNYVLKVLSPDPSKTHLLTLYFLDSGAYADKGWSWWKPTEYDWIHESQRDWFLEESRRIHPIERPFTPDGVKDIGGIWRPRNDTEKTLAKPNALVFFHIPLPEAYADADPHEASGSPTDVGVQLEGPAAAKHNGNFFEEAILRARERDSEDGGSPGRSEVKVIANGHCHITDRCRRVSGVWMCFGGGGSFSGYGKIGFDRRFRIYDISDFGETIKTYKRTESGEIMDAQVLVGKGDL